MAISRLCIATVLLSLHAANSYILLTANIEDVHALAKQIAASPVGDQLNKIIRRASSVFKEQFNNNEDSSQFQLRSDPNKAGEGSDDNKNKGENNDDIEVWKPDPNATLEFGARSSGSESEESKDRGMNRLKRTDSNHFISRRHQVGQDLLELGKNASFYLTSIKKIFENV